MKPAIIEGAITQLVEEARAALAAERDADALVAAYDRKLGESREIARARRIELGMILRKAKEVLPKRGTSTNGWAAFLGAIEMSETTAYRYLEEVGWVSNRSQTTNVGVSDQPDAPPPRDEDAPPEPTDQPAAPDVEIDRDTWCTPQWITDAIGEWDLDPCANERSHVQAKQSFDLEVRGEDGLVLAADVPKKSRVFINPPYSEVGPWIEAYAHTRFCFLLKVDPSTKWFARLLELTEVVLMPRGTRVQFEAPANVPPEMSKANPFPHALFFAREADATDAIRELCFTPWRIR
jgi:hypothetical protein